MSDKAAGRVRFLSAGAEGDPGLAPYRAVRDRDLARDDGRFLIEGKIALETALRHGRFPLESVLLAEGAATRWWAASGLAAEAPGADVMSAPAGVIASVTGVDFHRGVLACARRATPLPADKLFAGKGPGVWLALLGLSNTDNVGSCFRNAAAFGVRGVLLDPSCCDPLYRKAIRVSSGASLWMPFATAEAADIAGLAERHGAEAWALTPRADASPIFAKPVPERVVLVLGAEGPGLPEDVINAMTPVSLPMLSPAADSLNVATAAAVALAELSWRPIRHRRS